MNVGDPAHSSGVEVVANKCNSEEAAMMNRKSDQSYYLRSGVMATEERIVGGIDL